MTCSRPLIRPDRRSPNTETGRQGELLAQYTLERRGVQCSYVDRAEIDLWVRTVTGEMATIQVKTCSEPKRDRDRPLRYRFEIPRDTTADYLALVALDRQIVIICPTTSHIPGLWQPDSFTKEAQDASIAEHLA